MAHTENCRGCMNENACDYINCRLDENKRIYNQALEDAENRYREWSAAEYGKIVADDVLPIRVLRSLKNF